MLSRRAFLARLAVVLPTAAIVRRAHALAIDEIAAGPRTLRALGAAVLPTALGAERTTAAVDAFREWIAGYRAGAELVHGYGTSIIERSGPTPATRWAAQLDTLDAIARRRHGTAFADLRVPARRAIVRDALDAAQVTALTTVVASPHVAAALLAHWYGTPGATDLCYEVRIGRQTCRPLGAQARRPLPIAEPRA